MSTLSSPLPDRLAGAVREATPGSRRRPILTGGAMALAALTAAGVLSTAPSASAATTYTFDTGSGLVFTIDGSNGNMTSLRHNGIELAASGQAAGQFESGWSSATVTAQSF